MAFEERRWEREGLTDLVSCGRIAAMEPFVSPGAQQTGLCPPLKKKNGRGADRRMENVRSNKSNLSFTLFSFAI